MAGSPEVSLEPKQDPQPCKEALTMTARLAIPQKKSKGLRHLVRMIGILTICNAEPAGICCRLLPAVCPRQGKLTCQPGL